MMNECHIHEIQQFFQLFQHTLDRIQINYNEAFSNLSVSPIFAIQTHHDEQHTWQIQAFYQSISATNPIIEIEYFLNRLVSSQQIKEQNIHDLFSLVAHYCQAQYTNLPQQKLFALYRHLYACFFASTLQITSIQQHEICIEHQQIEACKQQLRAVATQLKNTALHQFLDPTITNWYLRIWSEFDLHTYNQFSLKIKPHIGDLKRWEQENPNRLFWFLLWQDFNSVDDPSYFSYMHLMQINYLDVPLFQHKGQIKQLFAQAPDQFITLLKLVFSASTQKAYASQIIFNLIPHLSCQEQLLNLSMMMPHGHDSLYGEYAAQYSHALALNLHIIQNLEQFNDVDLSLNDFIYGQQIHGTEYTQLPNIALIQSSTTAQSLIRHSAIWHKKSQRIQISNYPFDFKASSFQLHDCTFELICNTQELLAEAQEMEHCILSFASSIHHEQYYCFRVFWQEFRGTLGLRYNKNCFKYEFHQLTAPRNAPAPEYVIRVAKTLSEYLTVEDIYFDNPLIAA
jgi:hypothetical protein